MDGAARQDKGATFGEAVTGLVLAESRRAVLWLPVLMGLGIWFYFALTEEPPAWTAAIVALPFTGAILFWRRLGWGARAALAVMMALTAGYALAVWATHRAAEPVLPWDIAETVEGRVVALDRSRAGAPRVILDRVVIYGFEPADWPARIRVSLLETDPLEAPRPGDWIRVYARLIPPGSPVEPGAFDFRRTAYFAGLGGVGYARGYAQRLPLPAAEGVWDGATMALARFRQDLADGIRASLPGAEGAFAAAIITGDRAAIEEADAEALRISNLAHLLAISGLHMGLLTGLVFGFARLALAAVPGISLRYPVKKWAAMIALAAGAFYLALSGATVATQRAFIMVAVAFTAVMMDRPALTLRALALAAAIVLAIRPVSLLDVGFQMSFAATAALVAGFEAIRTYSLRKMDQEHAARRSRQAKLLRKLGLYASGLVLTSLIAGLATAPYAAYHFSRTGSWGLVANLAAVPVMGLWIAPMAILSGLLAPFGLAQPALEAMGAGIAFVLQVAHTVAGWPGAVQFVPAAPGAVLPLITLGGLWLCLWRGSWRLLGLGALALGFGLWAAAPLRPELLVAPEGKLVGLMGPDGRALDRERGQGFAAETWLRRDGDRSEQGLAAARGGLETKRGFTGGTLSNGWRFAVIRGRKPKDDRLAELCEGRVLLIVPSGRRAPPGDCAFLGRSDLRQMGALAIRPDGTGIAIESSDGGRRRAWMASFRDLSDD